MGNRICNNTYGRTGAPLYFYYGILLCDDFVHLPENRQQKGSSMSVIVFATGGATEHSRMVGRLWENYQFVTSAAAQALTPPVQ